MVWRGAGSHVSHWQLFALQVNMAINIAYQGDAGGPVEDQRPLRSREAPVSVLRGKEFIRYFSSE